MSYDTMRLLSSEERRPQIDIGVQRGGRGNPNRRAHQVDQRIQQAITRMTRVVGCCRIPNFNQEDWNTFLERTAALEEPNRMERCLKRLKLSHILSGLNEGRNELDREAYTRVLKYVASFDNPRPLITPARVPDKPGMLENLSVALHYFSADHEPTNPWEAMSMLQVYGLGLATPLFLAIAIDVGIFDDLHLDHYHRQYVFAAIVGLLIFGILALKAYRRFHRIPVGLKPFTNLTAEAKSGRIEPLLGRDDIVNRVFRSWLSTNTTTRQHPLLVGPAGVGKTAIMAEVARRMVIGDVPTAVEGNNTDLKKKVVFGGNAASLLPTNQMMETEEKLERFLRRVYPIKDDVVLAIDEVQSFMNEQFGFRYGELLKSILDVSARGLPYMMFATTDEDYRKYIKDVPALARRFLPIYVDSLSKPDVLSILQHLIRRQYPGFPVTEGLLDYIYDKSDDLCREFDHLKQPEISKRVLSRVITKISVDKSQPRSHAELRGRERELLNLLRRNFTLENPLNQEEQAERLRRIEDLEREVNRLRNQSNNETNGLEEFKNTVKSVDKCEEEVIDLAKRIQQARAKNRDSEDLQKRFYFLFYYLIPHLKTKRDQLINHYNISRLDNAAIDEVVDEIQESLRQAREAERQDQAAGAGQQAQAAGPGQE